MFQTIEMARLKYRSVFREKLVALNALAGQLPGGCRGLQSLALMIKPGLSHSITYLHANSVLTVAAGILGLTPDENAQIEQDILAELNFKRDEVG